MTKAKKIKDAWGFYFEHFGEHATKYALENNGYCSVPSFTLGLILRKHGEDWLETDKDLKRRPKSLQGIEDNNGWIKIESEEDLPKEVIECRNCFYNGKNYIEGVIKKRSPQELSRLKYINEITHYQPIEKLKPPIY